MSTSSIDYKPLNIKNAEIRVLMIDQDNESSKVVCTMQTVSLADANPFYALSYVWGDMNHMQEITVNGQCLRARKNLCDFLRSLRDAMQGKIRVWVDYLCINQNDLDERSAQVAMMSQIYSAADSVYAWLGQSTDDSKKVFDFIEQSKRQCSSGEPYRKINVSNSTFHHALQDLIERPYWTRLWIIQEIVLAKRLWLFCGPRYINWHDLHFVLGNTKQSSSINARKDNSQDTMRLLQHLKRSRESSGTMTLSTLVHKFVSAQCQDQRDKIYGLLSLAHQDMQHTVKVDYRKPLLQVLIDMYTSWASEWVLDQDVIYGVTSETHSYTPALFCQELELLFPTRHLLELYDSQSLRKQVTAKVTFKGFRQSGLFEFRHIALIRSVNEDLIPMIQLRGSELKASTSPVVSQMTTPDGYDTFVYTTIAPLPKDEIINVGPIMLLVREQDGQTFIAGRGIQQRCTDTGALFDPRLWNAQLLPDSIFRLTSYDDGDSGVSVRRLSAENSEDLVNVELNAAALVELLIASKEQGREWKPHEFGLQYHIVDMCKECRLTMQFGKPDSATKDCRCVWASSDESFIGDGFGSLRRYDSLPPAQSLL